MKTEALVRAGELAKQIKSKILGMKGKTYSQVDSFIRAEIIRGGYRVLFPVNLNADKVLAHRAISKEEGVLGHQPFTTIDFGFYLEPVMVDTAVTVCSSPEEQLVLEEYRKILARVVQDLRVKYESEGKLSVSYITRLVQTSFAPLGHVVEECCSHQMRYPKLHASTIPMGGLRYPLIEKVLRPGALFTLEPHICLKPYRVIERPGSIKLSKDKVTYDLGEGSTALNEIHLSSPGFYQEHNIYLEEKTDGTYKLHLLN